MPQMMCVMENIYREEYYKNGALRCRAWRVDDQLHRDDKNQPALGEYYEDGTIKAKEWGEWDRELLDFLPPDDEVLPHREEYYKNGSLKPSISHDGPEYGRPSSRS